MSLIFPLSSLSWDQVEPAELASLSVTVILPSKKSDQKVNVKYWVTVYGTVDKDIKMPQEDISAIRSLFGQKLEP